MIDVDGVRADIPALPDLVYLDNAGTSLMAKQTFDALLDYLHREQQIGGYETADERQSDTDNFYTQAAELVNASVSEIAFCESASKAWQLFFYSLQLQPGDHIITTQLDYGSHFVSFQQLRDQRGILFTVVGTDENGDIDLGEMAAAFTPRTKLVSMSHIPTANGVINPAKAVGELARERGVMFLLDACQSVGQIEVDVKDIGCSALSVTGRKYLRGPRGTGFLYISSESLQKTEPGWLEQHSVELLSSEDYRLRVDARRYENFEVNYAGRVALGRAMEYANNLGLANIEQRIMALSAYCREQLATVPSVALMDHGLRRGGILTLSFDRKTPEEVAAFLKQQRIRVGVSGGPGSLIDFQQRGIQSLIRVSLHYFNTREEIDLLVSKLRSFV